MYLAFAHEQRIAGDNVKDEFILIKHGKFPTVTGACLRRLLLHITISWERAKHKNPDHRSGRASQRFGRRLNAASEMIVPGSLFAGGNGTVTDIAQWAHLLHLAEDRARKW